MDNRLRAVIGFLAGFDAAARTLSFTKAAAELNLTQSAVSRQIQSLEGALGVVLFERFNRRLALTESGVALHRTVATQLRELDEAFTRLRAPDRGNVVTVGATVAFASLWLVPRLTAFRREHPEIDVHIAADNAIVEPGTRGIDVSVRFGRADTAPAGAQALFAEEVFPVCAPSLLQRRDRALRTPRDLAHHVLLHYAEVRTYPWMDWSQWLTANGVAGLSGSGSLTFSHYDQLIQASVAGEGVALGRTPLIERLLRSGDLVAPLRGRAASRRQYYLIAPDPADSKPAVRAFMQWMLAESAATTSATDSPTSSGTTLGATSATAASNLHPARDTPPPARSPNSSRPGRVGPGPAAGGARRRAR